LRHSVFGMGRARVCAVIATPRARDFRKLVLSALKQTPTVELRLDWLANDRERHAALDWLKRSPWRNAVFIATCRRRVGGGEFAGGAGEELFWLMKAKEAGCTWCDLEIETVKELRSKLPQGNALPRKVMLSIHDFRRTPRFENKFKSPHKSFAALKVAAMSRILSDSARLLRQIGNANNIVAIPMGEIGLPGRILALREGSALAYAPMAAATAPGQVSLDEFLKLYRAHELTHKTRVYGVIGNPISHSLSPLLHNTGYAAARRDAVFLPFLVENLREFLQILPEFSVRGFSVTIPHKEKIVRHLDECDPLAEQIGAVNTVTVRRDGKLVGSNTDYVGVLRALERKIKLKGSRAVILGAGGAARAAAFALAKAGAEVLVCARREGAAKQLARAVHGSVLRRFALRREKFDALVNATPVGMHPHAGSSPLLASELNCSLVLDLIYRPLHTKLLQLAKARGIRVVSGVEMFLAQGIAQWELWMGGPAPEAVMRRAVLRALHSEDVARQRLAEDKPRKALGLYFLFPNQSAKAR
jgi:3-dehydroquinate dehydratase / shikimate dehydrogenase